MGASRLVRFPHFLPAPSRARESGIRFENGESRHAESADTAERDDGRRVWQVEHECNTTNQREPSGAGGNVATEWGGQLMAIYTDDENASARPRTATSSGTGLSPPLAGSDAWPLC